MLIIITIFAIILNSGSLKLIFAKNPTRNNEKKVAIPNIIMPKNAKIGFDNELASANAPYSIPHGINPKIKPNRYPRQPNEL